MFVVATDESEVAVRTAVTAIATSATIMPIANAITTLRRRPGGVGGLGSADCVTAVGDSGTPAG